MSFEVGKAQRVLAEACLRGEIGPQVVEALLFDGEFIPKECELWDFKQQYPGDTDKMQLGKFVVAIVSFYNAFGGYLIVGVAESEDRQRFVPFSGNLPNQRDIDSLKAKVEDYTGGTRIALTLGIVRLTIAGAARAFAVIHVPQRHADDHQALFVKPGPQDGKKPPLFVPGSTYVRWDADCVPVQTQEQLKFLLSQRDVLRRFAGAGQEARPPAARVVDNTLPDRQRVCPYFVGREEFIRLLWAWMTDDFDRVRVLAGEGGRGKTSLAFEFATEVCRLGPPGVDRVLWLTGKRRQFVGAADAYRDLAQPDFHDVASLFGALGGEYALASDETDESLGRSVVLRNLVGAIRLFPALIVIDDVDSIEGLDEQRRVHEIVLQLASSTRSRFLVTTRMNLSYSPDTCLTIAGLETEEYAEFVRGLAKRLGVDAKFTGKQFEKLRAVTDGSPLFTESLLRLMRQGETLSSAIAAWRGKDGEAARSAALRREAGQLSPEARRVLLVVAHLGEASLAEISNVTGLHRPALAKHIGELQAMYLLSAPTIGASEPRFRIGETTARFALEVAGDLVSDPKAVAKKALGLKTAGMVDGRQAQNIVGSAVRQAIAQLRVGNFDGAIQTAEAAVERTGSGDAYFLLGRSHYGRWNYSSKGEQGTVDHNALARNAFQKARSQGCKKIELYELWFDAEFNAEHFAGAVDVATHALEANVGAFSDWSGRRAIARLRLARIRRLNSSPVQAREDYLGALKDAREAAADSSSEHQRRALLATQNTIEEEVSRIYASDAGFRDASRRR